MEFILVLASVFLLSHSGWLTRLHQDDWFETGKEVVYGFSFPKLAADFLLVAIPLVIVFVVSDKLGQHWLGLLSFFVAGIVFFYSLGRTKHDQHIEHFQECLSRDDQQGAFNAVHEFIDENQVEGYPQLQTLFEKGLLHHRFDRWFVIVFWFLLTGPVGALAYRILAFLDESSADDGLYRYKRVTISGVTTEEHAAGEDSNAQPAVTASQLLYILEWVPARLMGISFGLVGQFSGFAGQLPTALDVKARSADCLHNCALLALDYQSASDETDSAAALLRLKAIERLIRHSMILWVALVAFVQLLG